MPLKISYSIPSRSLNTIVESSEVIHSSSSAGSTGPRGSTGPSGIQGPTGSAGVSTPFTSGIVIASLSFTGAGGAAVFQTNFTPVFTGVNVDSISLAGGSDFTLGSGQFLITYSVNTSAATGGYYIEMFDTATTTAVAASHSHGSVAADSSVNVSHSFYYNAQSSQILSFRGYNFTSDMSINTNPKSAFLQIRRLGA